MNIIIKRIQRKAGLWDNIKDKAKNVKEKFVGISDNEKQDFIQEINKINNSLKKYNNKFNDLENQFNNILRPLTITFRIPEEMENGNYNDKQIGEKLAFTFNDTLNGDPCTYQKEYYKHFFNEKDNRMTGFYFNNNFELDFDKELSRLKKKTSRHDLYVIANSLAYDFSKEYQHMLDTGYTKSDLKGMTNCFEGYIKSAQQMQEQFVNKSKFSEETKNYVSMTFNAYIDKLNKANNQLNDWVQETSNLITHVREVYSQLTKLATKYKK